MKIQVVACDKDREVPALTYEIQVSDGRTVSADLCARHAAKIEALIAELVQDGEKEAAQPAPELRPEPEPAKKAAAKKTTARKTAVKKTTSSRRRPKVTTLEEIEAQKKQG